MNTQDLVLKLLEEEYNQIQGTILLHEHQLSIELKFRRLSPEDLDEDNLKNLRMYRANLLSAINEIKPRKKKS